MDLAYFILQVVDLVPYLHLCCITSSAGWAAGDVENIRISASCLYTYIKGLHNFQILNFWGQLSGVLGLYLGCPNRMLGV